MVITWNDKRPQPTRTDISEKCKPSFGDVWDHIIMKNDIYELRELYELGSESLEDSQQLLIQPWYCCPVRLNYKRSKTLVDLYTLNIQYDLYKRDGEVITFQS